jgi:hypothetical protein
MRVRILKAPPASVLEGLDLRPYRLKVGETRELRSPIADILVAWGYARLARAKLTRAPVRPTKKAQPVRKK